MASNSGCDLVNLLTPCTATQGMVVGNWCLQGRQPLTMGQSPLWVLKQIGPDSVFGGSWVKGPSSLALLRMCCNNGQWLWLWFGTFTHAWPAPRRIVLGTYNLQGRWSLFRGRFPVSFKQIGPDSVFRGIWAKWLSSPAPPDSWGWCTAGRSRHNLAHLLAPVLLLKVWCQGRQPPPWGRSLVSFGQIGLGSVFQQKSQDKGPASFALPRMVHHPWPAALDIIWQIYSHLYCSSRDGGRDLPSSREEALTMRKVTCEFWADRPGFSFQGKSWDKGPSSLALPRMVHHPWPVAPDMIWHIYSHLYCSLRDGGRDLSSSGEAAPTIGQVSCEFRADRPNFIFQLVAPDVI